jgi:two-component system, NtrC family, nitrogen regulation response regulator GlnG
MATSDAASIITEITALAAKPKTRLLRRARLVVLSGSAAGQELPIGAAGCLIGKDASCQLRLDDPQVSRKHLEVHVVDAGLLLRDLGSKNGTFVGATRISEVVVAPGTVIKIGVTEIALADGEVMASLPPSSASSFGRLQGRSLKMREVYAVLERVAHTDVPVLIGGETGTGKELCAEALHQASRVASGPFVVCDVAGMPRTLIETEMFGHVRGAFTGADRPHEGAFVRAHGGTIFIDEIGELELELQPRLLRVLEQRQVRPIGSGSYRAVDIRVISATNRDLRADCRRGAFRQDLFHRLGVVEVTLPPLRERKEDIALLVEGWLAPRGISATDETLHRLEEHDWPGNVRELRNVIERGVSLLSGEKVLEARYLGLDRTRATAAFISDYKRAKEELIAPWEREFVRALLQRTGGNVSLAAREGGLDRTYLHRLMRKYDIKARTPDGD